MSDGGQDAARGSPHVGHTGHGGHGGHGGGETSSRKLAVVAGINVLGFLAELAGGLAFGSVALLSDAVHMLFDGLAYVMAFGAAYVAEHYGDRDRWSYGLHRLEPIAAFLNGVLLVPMVGFILWESARRFLDPVSISPVATLIVATGGLGINLAAVYVLQGEDMSLNERGAFYHLLGDAGGSVAVIVSTVAVMVFDLPVVDPLAAVLIAVLILWSAGTVVRESASILLHWSPVAPADLEADIDGIDGVERVEDIHVWQVCSRLTVGTVRAVDTAATLDERRRIRTDVHDRLRTHGIDHATVELVDAAESDAGTGRGRHSH